MISNYAFYRDVYLGTVLSEDAFPRYAREADSWLDQLTYGKYASSDLSEEVLRKVKFSECSLAELCLSMATDAASNPSIEKETVGSHSVTYRGSTDSISGWSARIRETASRYLMTTGLLYRGAILRFKL